MAACLQPLRTLKRSLKKRKHERNLRQLQAIDLVDENARIHRTFCSRDDECFDPPIAEQRFLTVKSILERKLWKNRIKKVVEFGSGDSSFLKNHLRRMKISEIIQVELNEGLVNASWSNATPKTEQLSENRADPQRVIFFAGNAALQDERFLGADAVVAIELLQHLYPDALEALVYNVFAYIKPFMVIFTTANAEFKPCLSQKYLDEKFHTPDVTLMWTKRQFQAWGINICVRYQNYMVRFHGIGAGPKGFDQTCQHTQAAIFLRHDRPTVSSISLYDSALPRSTKAHGICTHERIVEIYKPMKTISTTLEFSHFSRVRPMPSLVAFDIGPVQLAVPCLFLRQFDLRTIRKAPIVQLVCPDETVYCASADQLAFLLRRCGFLMFRVRRNLYLRGALLIATPVYEETPSSAGTDLSSGERRIYRRWRRRLGYRPPIESSIESEKTSSHPLRDEQADTPPSEQQVKEHRPTEEKTVKMQEERTPILMEPVDYLSYLPREDKKSHPAESEADSKAKEEKERQEQIARGAIRRPPKPTQEEHHETPSSAGTALSSGERRIDRRWRRRRREQAGALPVALPQQRPQRRSMELVRVSISIGIATPVYEETPSSAGIALSSGERRIYRRWRRRLEEQAGALPVALPEQRPQRHSMELVPVSIPSDFVVADVLRIEIPSADVGRRYRRRMQIRERGEDTESDIESIASDVEPVRMATAEDEINQYDVSWWAIMMERPHDEDYATDFTPIEQRKQISRLVGAYDTPSTTWRERIYQARLAEPNSLTTTETTKGEFRRVLEIYFRQIERIPFAFIWTPEPSADQGVFSQCTNRNRRGTPPLPRYIKPERSTTTSETFHSHGGEPPRPQIDWGREVQVARGAVRRPTWWGQQRRSQSSYSEWTSHGRPEDRDAREQALRERQERSAARQAREAAALRGRAIEEPHEEHLRHLMQLPRPEQPQDIDPSTWWSRAEERTESPIYQNLLWFDELIAKWELVRMEYGEGGTDSTSGEEVFPSWKLEYIRKTLKEREDKTGGEEVLPEGEMQRMHHELEEKEARARVDALLKFPDESESESFSWRPLQRSASDSHLEEYAKRWKKDWLQRKPRVRTIKEPHEEHLRHLMQLPRPEQPQDIDPSTWWSRAEARTESPIYQNLLWFQELIAKWELVRMEYGEGGTDSTSGEEVFTWSRLEYIQKTLKEREDKTAGEEVIPEGEMQRIHHELEEKEARARVDALLKFPDESESESFSWRPLQRSASDSHLAEYAKRWKKDWLQRKRQEETEIEKEPEVGATIPVSEDRATLDELRKQEDDEKRARMAEIEKEPVHEATLLLPPQRETTVLEDRPILAEFEKFRQEKDEKRDKIMEIEKEPELEAILPVPTQRETPVLKDRPILDEFELRLLQEQEENQLRMMQETQDFIDALDKHERSEQTTMAVIKKPIRLSPLREIAEPSSSSSSSLRRPLARREQDTVEESLKKRAKKVRALEAEESSTQSSTSFERRILRKPDTNLLRHQMARPPVKDVVRRRQSRLEKKGARSASKDLKPNEQLDADDEASLTMSDEQRERARAGQRRREEDQQYEEGQRGILRREERQEYQEEAQAVLPKQVRFHEQESVVEFLGGVDTLWGPPRDPEELAEEDKALQRREERKKALAVREAATREEFRFRTIQKPGTQQLKHVRRREVMTESVAQQQHEETIPKEPDYAEEEEPDVRKDDPAEQSLQKRQEKMAALEASREPVELLPRTFDRRITRRSSDFDIKTSAAQRQKEIEEHESSSSSTTTTDKEKQRQRRKSDLDAQQALRFRQQREEARAREEAARSSEFQFRTIREKPDTQRMRYVLQKEESEAKLQQFMQTESEEITDVQDQRKETTELLEAQPEAKEKVELTELTDVEDQRKEATELLGVQPETKVLTDVEQRKEATELLVAPPEAKEKVESLTQEEQTVEDKSKERLEPPITDQKSIEMPEDQAQEQQEGEFSIDTITKKKRSRRGRKKRKGPPQGTEVKAEDSSLTTESSEIEIQKRMGIKDKAEDSSLTEMSEIVIQKPMEIKDKAEDSSLTEMSEIEIQTRVEKEKAEDSPLTESSEIEIQQRIERDKAEDSSLTEVSEIETQNRIEKDKIEDSSLTESSELEIQKQMEKDKVQVQQPPETDSQKEEPSTGAVPKKKRSRRGRRKRQTDDSSLTESSEMEKQAVDIEVKPEQVEVQPMGAESQKEEIFTEESTSPEPASKQPEEAQRGDFRRSDRRTKKQQEEDAEAEAIATATPEQLANYLQLKERITAADTKCKILETNTQHIRNITAVAEEMLAERQAAQQKKREEKREKKEQRRERQQKDSRGRVKGQQQQQAKKVVPPQPSKQQVKKDRPLEKPAKSPIESSIESEGTSSHLLRHEQAETPPLEQQVMEDHPLEKPPKFSIESEATSSHLLRYEQAETPPSEQQAKEDRPLEKPARPPIESLIESEATSSHLLRYEQAETPPSEQQVKEDRPTEEKTVKMQEERTPIPMEPIDYLSYLLREDKKSHPAESEADSKAKEEKEREEQVARGAIRRPPKPTQEEHHEKKKEPIEGAAEAALGVLQVLPAAIGMGREQSLMERRHYRYGGVQGEWTQELEDQTVAEQMALIASLQAGIDGAGKPIESTSLDTSFFVHPRVKDLQDQPQPQPPEAIIAEEEEEAITIVEEQIVQGTEVVLRREVGVNVEDTITKQDKEMEAAAKRRSHEAFLKYKKEHADDPVEVFRKQQQREVMGLLGMAREAIVDPDDPLQKQKVQQLDDIMKQLRGRDGEKKRAEARAGRTEEKPRDDAPSSGEPMRDQGMQTDTRLDVHRRVFVTSMLDKTDDQAPLVEEIGMQRKEINALMLMLKKKSAKKRQDQQEKPVVQTEQVPSEDTKPEEKKDGEEPGKEGK